MSDWDGTHLEPPTRVEVDGRNRNRGILNQKSYEARLETFYLSGLDEIDRLRARVAELEAQSRLAADQEEEDEERIAALEAQRDQLQAALDDLCSCSEGETPCRACCANADLLRESDAAKGTKP